MTGPTRWLLVALHFVCPLLFFTNLTRNPYYTQIALLNIGLLAAVAFSLGQQARGGQWRVPRTPVGLPIVVFLGVCAASWTYAYLFHADFYRDSMRAEGLRVMLFTVVNMFVPFYLAASSAEDCPEDPDVRIGPWMVFALVWALLWSFYPQLRGSAAASTSVYPHLWDPYGALVWVCGLAWVLWLSRSGGVHAIWHVALVTGLLAAVYGIGQYFSVEFFWPKILNPYGVRSVSTFGNPNFLSSYLVMLLPLAVTYYLHARTRLHRALYAVVLLAFQAALLCTLTRSSWIGAAAAAAPLVFSRRLRRLAREDVEFHGLVFAFVVLLGLFWPQSNVAGYAPTVIGRLSEMGEVFAKDAGAAPYSPLYQRFLIWLCAWTMGAENPLLGKGWGLMELFYPFYQGHFMEHFEIFRALRTHANNAHNELLELWAQGGILGTGAFIWLWVVFFRAVWDAVGPKVPAGGGATEKTVAERKGRARGRTAAQPPDAEHVWMLAASAGLFGMIVDNLLNVSLHFAVPAFLFWWQAGIVMGHLSLRQGRWRTLRFPSRAAAAAAALAMAGLCAWGSWHWASQWNREVRYFMGFKFMRRGDPRRAIDQLTAAYRWHPREVNTNYELGNAYARSDRYEKAVWAYGEALKANAGYDEIYFNLGTILSTRLGRREEAIANYRTSWAINPLSHQLYVNFISLLLQGELSKEGELAVSLLEDAAHFFPGEMNFLVNLGSVYNLRGEHGKAEVVYARILRARPEMAAAERNLRASIGESGHPAPEVLAQVEEYRRLGQRLSERRFDEGSLKLARQVSEWFPGSLQARFYLGNLEMVHGDVAKAERLLREVVRDNPKNVAALLNLAQILKRTGKPSEAAGLLRSALSIEPDNELAQSELRSIGP
ncbi:MAG: tetratricopeptide repeat protein [Elusimicrobiota bacterium]